MGNGWWVIVLCKATIKWALLKVFSLNPSFKWRTGDTVKIHLQFGFNTEMVNKIDSILCAMISGDRSSLLNCFWGTLWQLATICLVSMFRYTQDVPKVMIIWVESFNCVCVKSIISFKEFKNTSLSGFDNSEWTSKQCHIEK